MARRSRTTLLTMPRVFGVMVLALGLAFALLTPPLLGFDENAHFLRAYQVSSGSFIPHRDARAGFGEIPQGVVADLSRTTADALLPGRDRTAFLDHLGDSEPGGAEESTRIGAIAGYNPIPYLPAAMGIGVGRIMGASTVVMVYLARLFSLAGYAILVVAAVTRARRARWFLAACALLPTALFGATTVSIDGLTYGLVLLALALMIRGFSSTDRWRPRDTRLVVMVAVLLGCAKPPYAFAILLLVPVAAQLAGWTRATIVSSVVASPALMIAWAKWMESPLSIQDVAFGAIDTNDKYHPYTNVDSAQQLSSNVLSDPFGFAQVLGRTVTRFGAGWLRDAPAQLQIGTRVSVGVALLAALAIALASLLSRGAFDGADHVLATGAIPVADGKHRDRRRRWWVAVVAFALAGATLVGAYVSWNALGSPRIYAYQGRYLAPVMPLIMLVLVPSRAMRRPTRVGVVSMMLAVSALGWYLALLMSKVY